MLLHINTIVDGGSYYGHISKQITLTGRGKTRLVRSTHLENTYTYIHTHTYTQTHIQTPVEPTKHPRPRPQLVRLVLVSVRRLPHLLPAVLDDVDDVLRLLVEQVDERVDEPSLGVEGDTCYMEGQRENEADIARCNEIEIQRGKETEM